MYFKITDRLADWVAKFETALDQATSGQNDITLYSQLTQVSSLSVFSNASRSTLAVLRSSLFFVVVVLDVLIYLFPLLIILI